MQRRASLADAESCTRKADDAEGAPDGTNPACLWADLAFEVPSRALKLLKGAAKAQGACEAEVREHAEAVDSQQAALSRRYVRVVGAQPRRRLPVWLAHAVSLSRFTSSPICGTHV